MSNIEAAKVLLQGRFGDRLVENSPLSQMTTYKVGGNAALFVEVASFDDLIAIAEVKSATQVPTLVIGRGSNMLVADAGFDGVAFSIAGFADQVLLPEPDTAGDRHDVVVSAGGAVALPVVARRTAALGLTGFEWAVGVPGSIGGAVRMNAGGHGSDMAAVLVDVSVVDFAGTCEQVSLDAASLCLRFRSSCLANSMVVVSARLKLTLGDRAASESEITEIVRWRREHQPGGQNCGSVFVNPVAGEITAGALIDDLGLRGLRIGSASVSDKHANFIQATDGGNANDVLSLIEVIRHKVFEATGFMLRSEVRLIGFDDEDPMARAVTSA